MKKLPGKKKPPTLTVKSVKGSGTSTTSPDADAAAAKKLKGLQKFGNIILKRGYTANALNTKAAPKESAKKKIPAKKKPLVPPSKLAKKLTVRAAYKTKTIKMPSMNKTGDVTMKRGVI